MSLLCLAIVGKDNEPLYQRDFVPLEEDEPAVVSDEEDCFGFASTMHSTKDTISLRHEVSVMEILILYLPVHDAHTVFSVHDALGAGLS